MRYIHTYNKVLTYIHCVYIIFFSHKGKSALSIRIVHQSDASICLHDAKIAAHKAMIMRCLCIYKQIRYTITLVII